MDDGMVELDSEFAKTIGFVSDKFDGYLWKEGNDIVISAIISKEEGKGNFSNLVKNIRNAGYEVIVPTPLGIMNNIVRKWGYKQEIVLDEVMGELEIWRSPPSINSHGPNSKKDKNGGE